MNDSQPPSIDRYLAAATRTNTRRSYASGVRHFEVTWGGHLPATADSVARYLAAYAGTLSTNTLKQRLAALAQWHTAQGIVDPTGRPSPRWIAALDVEGRNYDHVIARQGWKSNTQAVAAIGKYSPTSLARTSIGGCSVCTRSAVRDS